MQIEPRDAFRLPQTARTPNNGPPSPIGCSDPGPVFCRHRRVGLSGRTCGCRKIRTLMVWAKARLADILAGNREAAHEWAESQMLTHDPRVTWACALGKQP